ncbi:MULTISPECIES: porin family protein [Niastella]|uniref:PorT family protein n=1 Tax=Niastella soli TaxID=2821487 RepID=A0ABS3Z1J7_9BACT|nr:porin family protein [Niastella soli]MBO9203637.1 PorT family protein [Niastella soli]
MKYTLVCAALLLTFVANAQGVHFGIKADLNYSSLKGEGVNDKYSAGFQIGGFTTLNFSKHWAIQPELLYTWNPYKKGSDFLTYYNNTGRSAASDKINLAYISVPVLARYNVNKVISVTAGPQFGYLIYEDEDLLKEGRKAFDKTELSVNAGVQVNLDKVGFYARYVKGLTDINNVDDRYEWKSSHIQIGIAVRIK